MENEQLTQKQNAKSEYELKRQKKLEEQSGLRRKKNTKRVLKIVLIVIIVGVGVGALGLYFAKQPKTPDSDIISKNGLHWHPELTIVINGEKQEIPANIGIGVTHQPIHTHDATGVIHMEISGLVRQDDIKLGRFFEIWGEEFNSNCIFDQCSGSEGKMKMLVNGKENTEFENYHMQDKDKIEISYE